MALFGGLFNKEPQEIKEFWKAFKALEGKGSQKNFDAMVTAAAKCPDIWQGPFLLGLALDLPNEIPYDDDKANQYHYQAQQLANKAGDGEWVSSFYSWYRASAINYRRETFCTRERLAMRAMGVAAINNYENGKAVINTHDHKDDCYFWSSMFVGHNKKELNEFSPFLDVFFAWGRFEDGKASRDTMINYTNDLIKAYNKAVEKHNKLSQKVEKGKEVWDYEWDAAKDMYVYVTGVYLLYPSPFLLDEWAFTKENGGLFRTGIKILTNAASMGCAPAVHMLTQLYVADDEELSADTRNAMRAALKDIEPGAYLKSKLSTCAKKGDNEAAQLLESYF